MFFLAAPFPAIQTVTVLPNPQLSDQESLTAKVQTVRAMDGTLYTHVKRGDGRRKLQWTFRVSRNKGLELRAFLRSYLASKIRVTDHEGRIWVGYFITNPVELETSQRAAPAIAPMPRGELQTVTIEFEGVEHA